ncbi:MAG: hypothetical protein WC612_07560 [Bdellovibrionales bacterium]|jgi:hypothetical protein
MASPQIAKDGIAKVADRTETLPNFQKEAGAIIAACDDFLEQIPVIAAELSKMQNSQRPSLEQRVKQAHQELGF